MRQPDSEGSMFVTSAIYCVLQHVKRQPYDQMYNVDSTDEKTGLSFALAVHMSLSMAPPPCGSKTTGTCKTASNTHINTVTIPI